MTTLALALPSPPHLLYPSPPVQTHEEVLRLLLAAAPRLDAMELSNYLTRTLNNSKWVLAASWLDWEEGCRQASN